MTNCWPTRSAGSSSARAALETRRRHRRLIRRVAAAAVLLIAALTTGLIALHRAERFEATTLAEQTPRPEEKVEEDLPFVSAETLPRFQGQDLNGFRKWVQERITPSKIVLGSGTPGRVVVSFVIDTTGRLTQIRILQSPDRSLSDEVVRMLKQSPRWEPGRQFDRKVPVKFCIPVDFRQRQQPTKQDRNRD